MYDEEQETWAGDRTSGGVGGLGGGDEDGTPSAGQHTQNVVSGEGGPAGLTQESDSAPAAEADSAPEAADDSAPAAADDSAPAAEDDSAPAAEGDDANVADTASPEED
jgi:hypothetical protein